VRQLILAASVVCVVAAAPVWAASDDITAQANVLTPLTVTGVRTLDFEDVFPGVEKSVAVTDATSGKFSVAGTVAAEVNLSFTVLPASLVSGANTLPIVYGATDGGYLTSDSPASAIAFDPAVGATTNLHPGTGDLYVWIGGTVQPDVAQAVGLYTETITLDVTYTGN
jgi:hypothetical protein